MVDLSVKIDVSDVLAALAALDPKALEHAIANAVADEVVLPKLAKYPGRSGKKMQFVSERQRRFVMASIRSGDIRVPYHRTGRLSGSWQKQPISGGLALVSRLDYAPYVVGDGEQAAYHKGTWDTVADVADKSEADAALAATAAVVELIGSAGP